MTDNASDFTMKRMAQAVLRHCSPTEQQLIAQVVCDEPLRMTLMLNSAEGQRFTDVEIAAFILQCARRIKAGPIA